MPDLGDREVGKGRRVSSSVAYLRIPRDADDRRDDVAEAERVADGVAVWCNPARQCLVTIATLRRRPIVSVVELAPRNQRDADDAEIAGVDRRVVDGSSAPSIVALSNELPAMSGSRPVYEAPATVPKPATRSRSVRKNVRARASS